MADSTCPQSSSSGHNYNRSANWFQSLKRYVQETDVSKLDLSNMQLKTEETASILEILADSQVNELDLSGNNFKDQMHFLSQPLIETKIRKLNVSSCHLEQTDILNLMSVLKDTLITDLDVSQNKFDFYNDIDREFIPHLVQSRLTALNLAECFCFMRDEDALQFFQALPNTSITHLNLTAILLTPDLPDTLVSWFNTLKETSITHLDLSSNCVCHCLYKIGDSLRNSKLVELELNDNMIGDRDLDHLFEALVGTKITTLGLAHNSFKGKNNLGRLLKKTEIRNLDLSDNFLGDAKMFAFPHFLRGSSVVSLKLYNCYLSEEIGVKLMKSLKFSKLSELDIGNNGAEYEILVSFGRIVKHTKITNFDFSENFCSDGCASIALISFGELLVGSKLQHIDISQSFFDLGKQPVVFAEFIEKIKKSSVTSLNMCCLWLDKVGAEIISPSLANSQLTHLDLSCNFMEDGVLNLAAILKLTVITHLNLENCHISDTGAEALSECLAETQVTDLNLSRNSIASYGARALAVCLKDANISSLRLNENKIDSDGLEILAEHTNATLITVLEVNKNPGNRFPAETVIWNNRRLVHQIVSFFIKIAPESDDNCLRFELIASATNVDTFLDECLSFYKIICEHSSAIGVLAREEIIRLSRDQIATLLRDEFPKQFAWFIVSKIEADVLEHVRLLRKAEELGLNTIVELLLLNRPLYIINESHGILHPFTYKLLNKHKLPICNLDVEPEGIEKIIKYFTEFPNIEGAADAINLLKDVSEAAKKEDESGNLSQFN